MAFNYDALMSDAYEQATTETKKQSKYLNAINYDQLEKDTKSFNGGKGITRFKFEADGEYIFSFLPFPISKKHPRYAEMNAQGLPFDWKLNLFLHTIATESGSQKFVCPKKTYGKPCPFCDEKRSLFDEYGDWAGMTDDQKKNIKQYNDTERNFFFIFNHDDEQVYVMEYSEFFFYKNLAKKLNRTNGTDIKVSLPNPGENRHMVHFFVEPSSFKDRKGNPVIGEIKEIEFLPRDKAIPTDIVENLPALDSYINLYSYEDIQGFMDGTFFVEEAMDYKNDPLNEAPSAVAHREEVKQVEEEKAPIRIGRTGPSTVVEPEDDGMSEREKRRAERLAKQQSSEPTCPVPKGVFGENTDSFDECNDCPIYDACATKFDSSH